MSSEKYKKGMAIRREVLGDKYVDRAINAATDFTQPLQDLVTENCWEQKDCHQKEDCPAWEFQSGHLCWFLCGTLCECTNESSYKEKINICHSCKIFKSLIQ